MMKLGVQLALLLALVATPTLAEVNHAHASRFAHSKVHPGEKAAHRVRHSVMRAAHALEEDGDSAGAFVVGCWIAALVCAVVCLICLGVYYAAHGKQNASFKKLKEDIFDKYKDSWPDYKEFLAQESKAAEKGDLIEDVDALDDLRWNYEEQTYRGSDKKLTWRDPSDKEAYDDKRANLGAKRAARSAKVTFGTFAVVLFIVGLIVGCVSSGAICIIPMNCLASNVVVFARHSVSDSGWHPMRLSDVAIGDVVLTVNDDNKQQEASPVLFVDCGTDLNAESQLLDVEVNGKSLQMTATHLISSASAPNVDHTYRPAEDLAINDIVITTDADGLVAQGRVTALRLTKGRTCDIKTSTGTVVASDPTTAAASCPSVSDSKDHGCHPQGVVVSTSSSHHEATRMLWNLASDAVPAGLLKVFSKEVAQANNMAAFYYHQFSKSLVENE